MVVYELNKSFYDVEKKMENYIGDVSNKKEYRENVLFWYENFNPIFFPQMHKIATCLNYRVESVDKTDEENTYGLNKDLIEDIKKLGNDLNKFGGKDMMVCNFYIMSNFMSINNITPVNILWNNIGEWKY
tara:strand:- start:654 stop:1043 length:390 start_codon:yes stop_codon:yes gene_type:complete